ncbi:GNAT family N-acetyltransferase [Balneola sp. MJW-20]|uniref:GNAT family N-acetyltransferase n=1 Tax=Gracilimonas aurantiaca TaxID=3234185 RepID=UPI00346760C1
MEAYLYLEAHINAVESATDFTYKWCVNIGMEENEAARFSLALDELLTNMILFAYPETRGYIDLWYKFSLPQLEIIVQDSGEPFDPDKNEYSQEKALIDNDFKGAGIEIARKMTEHFVFLNRGKLGKEFRLAKEIPEQSLVQYQEEINQADSTDSEPEYKLHKAGVEDSEDIAKLIYRSYNYSYSKEDLYFPRQNELAIATGKKFGTIVRTDSGTPVGYFAVIRKPDSDVGEVGEAVVSPAHRRRSLMKKMMTALIEMSAENELRGLFGMAITVHDYSQRVNKAFGFKSTALMVAMAKDVKYRDLEEDYPQPVSLLADFLSLNNAWKPNVYLPERYEDILLKIYAHLEVIPCRCSGIPNSTSDLHRTETELNLNYHNNIAKVICRKVGTDFPDAMRSLLLSLYELELNVIYVDLPLEKVPLNKAVTWLHENGFIFSGLLPLFHDNIDQLRMQKIQVPVDFSIIDTYSTMAGEIKEFIRDEHHEMEKNKTKTAG